MQIENLYQNYLSSTGVVTDTRSITAGSIFFALKGEKFNANKFAAEALDKGAAFVVVDEIEDATWPEKFGERFILVEDVLKTLQQLSGYHRKQLKCPVIAITGSNGKTTTKELMAAVLGSTFKTYATKGNLNNHIGVPLTLLAIKSEAQMVIVEMGANHVGEIASYCEYAAPDYGLITNVGMAHTEGFGGFEGVVKGKTELYQYLGKHNGKIFVNAENELLRSKIPHGTESITYGRGGVYDGKITAGIEFLAVFIDSFPIPIKIQTNLVGDYNFENVISAACVGSYFGVSNSDIKEAIEAYVPGNNRSQKITSGTNTIILDAYNANPSSMAEALKNFEKIEAESKIVILGEMMELGEYAKAEHEKIAKTVSDMKLTQKVFTGAGFAFLKNEPGFTYFEKTEDLKTWFKQKQFENCFVLIKGSRKNELEKILS